DQRVSVSFSRFPRETPELPLLGEVLEGLDRMPAAREPTPAFLFDEFQHLVAEGGEAAERQLRAAVQRHRHLAYVFSGSQTRLLGGNTGDAPRALLEVV